MGLNQPVLHAANSIIEDSAGSTSKICTQLQGALRVSMEPEVGSRTGVEKAKAAGPLTHRQPCYHDHCQSFDADDKVRNSLHQTMPQGKPTGHQAGAGHLFPTRLHLMLSSAESEHFDHIVSWQPHGRSFKIHQPLRFATEVMPLWFQQTKFASFRRQLNLYGFSRLTRGADYSGYYHENFLQGHSEACEGMFRTRVKGPCLTLCQVKQPNFYDMPPCNAHCKSGFLETSTAGTPPNANGFVDSDTSNAVKPEDVLEVSDHNSDASTCSHQSEDTMSSTSRACDGGSTALHRPSLPSPLLENYEEVSPIDISLLIPASRCMSPMLSSNEQRHHDEFGDEMMFY